MSARSTCEICRVKDFDRSVRRSLTLAVFGRGLAASAGCTYKGAVDRRAFLGLVAASVAMRAGDAHADVPAPAAPDAPKPLQALLALELRRLGHPAAAGAIVSEGRVVAASGRGYRHKYRGGTVDSETVFRIGSVTKALTGVALLQLRDEGKLSLDDALSKLIPEAASVTYRAGEALGAPPITLRHLVTHTSGLPRNVTNAISEGALVAYLKGLRLEATPGAHTSYSNLGVGLLGVVIKRASGMSLRDYMRTRVFVPLGMTSAAWEAKDVLPKRLASGNEKKKDGEKKDEIEPVDTEWRMGAAEAFGGVYASADDLAKVALLALSAWDSGDEPFAAVLKRSSLVEAQTAATNGQPEPQRYGVCWWLGESGGALDSVWHSGATDEYSASLVTLPKQKIGAVVLTSYADVGWVESVARRIARKAADLGPAQGGSRG